MKRENLQDFHFFLFLDTNFFSIFNMRQVKMEMPWPGRRGNFHAIMYDYNPLLFLTGFNINFMKTKAHLHG
jgi:hypothetical protein